MKCSVPTLILLLAFTTSSFAATPSKESIQLLMHKTGAGEMGVQVMNQMLPALKQLAPSASDEFWNEFMKEVNSDDLIDQIIPIYQKHLSQSDIDDINKFFDSAAGKRFIASQPAIMQESMVAGQAWGQAIAQKVMLKAQAGQSK